MSALSIVAVASVSPPEAEGTERGTLSPCLGLAIGAGLLSWLALGSLLGIVLA